MGTGTIMLQVPAICLLTLALTLTVCDWSIKGIINLKFISTANTGAGARQAMALTLLAANITN